MHNLIAEILVNHAKSYSVQVGSLKHTANLCHQANYQACIYTRLFLTLQAFWTCYHAFVSYLDVVEGWNINDNLLYWTHLTDYHWWVILLQCPGISQRRGSKSKMLVKLKLTWCSYISNTPFDKNQKFSSSSAGEIVFFASEVPIFHPFLWLYNCIWATFSKLFPLKA